MFEIIHNVKLGNKLLRYSHNSEQLHYAQVGKEFNLWSFVSLPPMKNFRWVRGDIVMQVLIWQKQLAASKVYWTVLLLSLN